MTKRLIKSIKTALSGVDSDMPVVRSTPQQLPVPPSQGGPKQFSQSWGSEGFDPSTAKLVPSADMGRRMRDESRAFYGSNAGKNTEEHVTIKGDKARNPDRRAGSGFGNSYGNKADGGYPTMSPKQLSDFISEHARGNHGAQLNDFGAGLRIKDGMSVNKPQRPQNMHELPEGKPQGGDYMTKGDNYITKPLGGEMNKSPFNAKEYYKGDIKSAVKSTKSKFTLNDADIAIGLAGATGAGIGEAINYGMDQSYKQGVQSQQQAQSYWTNKKNADRGGK